MQAENQVKRPEPSVKRATAGFPGTVLNQNPDRRYLFANPGDDVTGLANCLDSGYHRVNHKSDKERVHSGATQSNGDVTFKGQVLLWIEKDIYEERQAEIAALSNARYRKSRADGGIDSIVGSDGKPISDMVPGKE